MTFTSLASSSHGNCYMVSDGKTAILLECGISFHRIKKELGFDLSAIRGCLVSHEHKDHAKSVMEIIKSGIEIFASEGTAEALDCTLITPVEAGVQFQIGSLEIVPFATFHDAEDPLGFLIYSWTDGDRLVFVTDTVNIPYRFPGVNILAVECNYASEILDKCTRLPDKVRHRITNTHMEVNRLCDWLSKLELSSCRELYLLHLSAACANEEFFVDLVERCVPKHVHVSACPK